LNTINSNINDGGVNNQTSSVINGKAEVEKKSLLQQNDVTQGNKDKVTISQEGVSMLMTDGNEPPATTDTDGNEPPTKA
jgi:hypothetical protein